MKNKEVRKLIEAIECWEPRDYMELIHISQKNIAKIVNYIRELENHQYEDKKIKNRHSRQIQKLRREIKQLKSIQPSCVSISPNGMKLYIGDKEVCSILEENDIAEITGAYQKIRYINSIYKVEQIITEKDILGGDRLTIKCKNALSGLTLGDDIFSGNN